jgi:hypothetical protein
LQPTPITCCVSGSRQYGVDFSLVVVGFSFLTLVLKWGDFVVKPRKVKGYKVFIESLHVSVAQIRLRA